MAETSLSVKLPEESCEASSPNIMGIKFLNSTPNEANFGNISHVTLFLENNGSSPLELFMLSLVTPCASLSLSLFHSIGILHAVTCQFIFLMTLTIWSDSVIEIVTTTCVIAALSIICKCFILKNTEPKNLVKKPDNVNNEQNRQSIYDLRLTYKGQIPFLTDYRSHLLLATAISILAVDFDIYPRRFAKTTSYGWSVMDIGVGSFVYIHAICSSQARGHRKNSMKKSIVSSFPLFLLGFMRLAVVTAVHYHRSITEYGVHWNFFFTLAITKMASSLLLLLSPYVSSGFMAMCILVAHQWLLSCKGVAEIILSEQRDNLFMENKEGICSLLGFLSIYLAGVELGRFFWKPRCKLKDWLSLFGLLMGTGCSSLIIVFLLHDYLQPTSRRMANMPYCTYVIAVTSLQIALHLLEHLILASVQYKRSLNTSSATKPNQSITLYSCLLWKAINYNGLFYFLLANVLTGIVNITINVDKASKFQSVCIISIYIFLLLSIVKIMMNFSVQLKFW